MKKALFAGVNAASVTAVRDDMSIDVQKSADHAKWLLLHGCNGLALLGTTGEANSFGVEERKTLLEGMVEAGVPADCLLPGTSTPSITDTVMLTRHAETVGCRGVLLLPPFYYKSPSDEGLFAFYSEVINRTGGDINIYLYHFPQQSAVPLSLNLIEMLLRAYPGKVKGIKDSAGDFRNTKAYIDNFSNDGFEVYTGADAGLLEALHAGAAGCITATSNLACSLSAEIYANTDNGKGAVAQEKLARIRNVVAMAQTVPAVKALLAHMRGDETWENIRPPLCKLNATLRQKLIASFDACKQYMAWS